MSWIENWDGWTRAGWLAYLEVAKRQPGIWESDTDELKRSYDGIVAAIKENKLSGTALLDALDYGDLLSAVIKARKRWGGFEGAGGVKT